MNQLPTTISILDDDRSVLRALTRLLRSAGWASLAFEDPVSFLEHSAKQSAQVVILDMSMPVMNGLEVQARLHSLSPAAQVIFLTSRDEPELREKALAAGAFAFLLKPADDDELLSAIGLAAGKTAAFSNCCPATTRA